MFVKKTAQEIIKKGTYFWNVSTRHLRVLPDFIIVGAQKCGTGTFYNNLVEHPSVIPAFVKEVHFFNNNFQKGAHWYKAHFPLSPYKYYITHMCKRAFLTGEATPGYIFHPHAPRRISEIIPKVKIIVLVRNPVDRAYSHYHHEVRKRRETLSFEDAIRMEEERLRGEFGKIMEDENYTSFNYFHYSYLLKGIYVDQLKRLSNFFNKEQILILKSEDFFHDHQAVFDRVLKFLNLPNWQFKDFRKCNVGHYPKINITTRRQLLDYFEPHNRRLYEYLGINFGWEK